MATVTRNKVMTSSIEAGVLTITHYTDPANGPQTVAGTLKFTLQDLPTPTILDLAGGGLARDISQSCNNSNGHPDVVAIATRRFESMKAGEWHPGKPAVESEPTDLQRAIAEITGQPIHYIINEFETRMQKTNGGEIWRDSRGKPRREFNAAKQAELMQDPEVAEVMARYARERAAAAKKGQHAKVVSTLFAQVAQ